MAKKKCPECKQNRLALPAHLRRVHGYSALHARNAGREQRVGKHQGSKLAELVPCVLENCSRLIVRVDSHLREFHKHDKDSPEYIS